MKVPKEQRRIGFNVRLEPQLHQQFMAKLDANSQSGSALIRKWIIEYLSDDKR